ncbi:MULTISPECIES: NAD(P)-binding domain-containing protein [unclassified Saccharopolyspora]|uniref:NAD(P)-binding domain-containing protein n=1 Tax=unclassified Saccharopolyspora TaxID=2646250 RepID=UPI001CD7AE3A|nr:MULTISPECIES: NAD(P)-binding domain-containing protein [unclassified Saccharopolyspora]MCA1186258.1 NAD(P)/FAD-dependent oxidoreductase [Saccharopolyspora sp. 6T]MCA1192223.1 NAD(P)/FAD-dependent oxidoreductase [Saccharopolyspora sp. 6V]MCA1227572.1 NAD(P)/FAD-dependent oxidoreductase [Saccharopolyspora sp. 6M]
MEHEVDVVVIGAGQAGLSSAHHLRRTGTGFVVLDAGTGAGGAWRHRWPSLRLGGVHGIHDLPGLALAEKDGARPASEVLAEYFARYEDEFELPVRRPVQVRSVRRGPDERLLVESGADTWAARAVINATGTWTKPFVPHYPGQESFTGRQLHVADYRGAEEFHGRRVAVVGGGISAVELLTEIAEVATTTWVTRRPPVFGDAEFTPDAGRRAVAEVDRRVRAGLPPGSVVSATGLPPTRAVLRARDSGVLDRHPMFERITPGGLRWADGTEVEVDVILWATGFRAALDHLAPLGVREPGGGIRMDGTRVVAEPRLHLVGYGPSASTIGANRAGRAAAREVHRLLRSSTTSR